MSYFDNVLENLNDAESWELERIRETLSDARFNSHHILYRQLISANIHMIDTIILDKEDKVKRINEILGA